MPNTLRIDPATIITQAPPGSAIYARNQLDAGTWEVSWLIREESARIARLHHPDIEFRAGALDQGFHGQQILLIPILVRIGLESQENIFETWVNVYQSAASVSRQMEREVSLYQVYQDEGGVVYLHDLARQDRLVLHFYGDHGTRERSLVIKNQLKVFASDALSLVERFPPWTMLAFNRAREQLYQRYPDVMALWKGLAS